MTKQTRDLVLMLLIGLLIGISAVMVWNSRGNGDQLAENNSSTPTGKDADTALPDAASVASIASPSTFFPLPPSIPSNTRVGLSVSDQPGGKTVTVQNLSITDTKWVAIYDDHDGKPGWILGAARVHEGDTSMTISLLRPEGTVSGGTYYAAILNDDGDGEFNRLTDLPPLSPDKVTIVRFNIK